ncbi:TPA: hypothetical protein NJ717_002146 [Vibrio parahaemolyticus]|nr:hypothetical protein [Vibrio parahaemolyticus]
MEKWKNGKMEKWKNGKMEKWSIVFSHRGNDQSISVQKIGPNKRLWHQ